MDAEFFRDKKKADLVDIVRTTGIMPVSHAQRMRKADLIEFLENAQRASMSGEAVPAAAPQESEPQQAPSEPASRKRSKRSSSRKEDAEDAQPVAEPTEVSQEPEETQEPIIAAETSEAKETAGQEITAPTPEAPAEAKAEAPAEKDETVPQTAEDAAPSEPREEDRPRPARPRKRRAHRRRVQNSPYNQFQEPDDQTQDEKEQRNSYPAPAEEEEEAADDAFDNRSRSGRQFTAKPRPRRSQQQQQQQQKKNDRQEAKGKQDARDDSEKDEAREREEETNNNSKQRGPHRQEEEVHGILEILQDGYGFLRKHNYIQGPHDVYVQPQLIRRFELRNGDEIEGYARDQKDQDRYQALTYITSVNGQEPESMRQRPEFGSLTPIYPMERYTLETTREALSGRMIDIIAPIGKGQRGMIVSPPKAGKTVMMKQIANAVTTNNPETHLMVLLIDERPEEVTDMERSINGEVISSTFDKTPENHVKIAELVLERAKRLVELGKDVLILLDSITRLARAYNLTITPTGRTLTGGLDPGALHGPKRFFGAARNIENGGSLTIIATALIDTGSRMDEVIFEEFKGTGNMEAHLDRKLADKRIYPAIDVQKSSTRREDLLLDRDSLTAIWTIRKALSTLDPGSATEMMIDLLKKTKSNEHFVMTLNTQKNDKAVIDAMR